MMAGGYTLIWRFQVRPDRLAEFLLHYRAEGTWAGLFRRSPGFVETLLLKDLSVADCYLTIDRWRSASAYTDFRRDFASDYARLDRTCECLTLAEAFLGAFGEDDSGEEDSGLPA